VESGRCQKHLARRFNAATLSALNLQNLHELSIMSQHRSLKAQGGATGAKRSVLKRGERIKLMKARGQWKEGRLPTGLPKTKPAA
jgi:small basic protein (TIGR04137 family)